MRRNAWAPPPQRASLEMQSTAHMSTQERSFTLMHGSAITQGISGSPEGALSQAPARVGGDARPRT